MRLLVAVLSVLLLGVAAARIGPGSATQGGPASLLITATTTTTLPTAADWAQVSTLQGVWYFEDGSGGPWVNSATQTTGRDFAANANGTRDTTNKIEGTASLSLPGTDAATITSSNAAWDNFFSNRYSVGCWIRPQAGPHTNGDVIVRWTSGNGFELGRVTSSGAVYAFVQPGGLMSWTTAMPVNTWTHYVFSQDNQTPFRRLILNGISDPTTPGNSAGAAQTNVPLTLSRVGSAFKGNIDECFVTSFNVPVTSICRICSCGVNGKLCTCDGTTFVTTGRNATNCNSCVLPANCSSVFP